MFGTPYLFFLLVFHIIYVLFIDGYSRFTWNYPLSCKSQVFDKFLEFKAYAEKQFDVSLKILRTDGGGEFYSKQFTQFLISQGIIHQKSCPFTPAQNGVAETKHRHITETTIALLQ